MNYILLWRTMPTLKTIRNFQPLCFDVSSDILALIFAAKYEKPAGQDPGFYHYHNDHKYGDCNVGIVVYTEG
jgi:hypothetical protein